MNDAAITVTGLQEVQKTLYAYSQQMGDRVVRGALRQGANYVLKGVREGVPVKTGLLKRRGFRVANSRIHNGRRASGMVGIYLSLRKGKGDPFYGRFQNDGWNPAGRKATAGDRIGMRMVFGSGSRMSKRVSAPAPGRGGNLYAKVPGKGFVQRAFAERKESAVQLIIQSAEAGAEAVKRRLGMKP